MTPEIHKKYGQLQQIIEMLAPTLQVYTLLGLDTFPDETSIFSGGAMDAILPHFMSIQNMNASQEKLKRAEKICRLINELRDACIIPQNNQDAA